MIANIVPSGMPRKRSTPRSPSCRRAPRPATAENEFRLVVVATEHGLYTESFGELPPEDALVLGAKLHAMGDLASAQAEVLLELECHEEGA